MLNTIGECGLAAVGKVRDLLLGAKADSLIDYTAVARVEPITLVDVAALDLEILPDLMQSMLSTFTGYYLQAAAISTNIGKIDVNRHLDKLNPNRRVTDSALGSAGWLLAQESYRDRLPTTTNTHAMEAEIDRSEQALGRETLATLRELSNLSVGKMITLEINDGQSKGTVPINVRLMAESLPSQQLIHILSAGSEDTSMKHRRFRMSIGQLEAWRDLVLCQDLISRHRQNLMHDKSGVYSEMRARNRKNQLSAIVSANPSVATASNIAIMVSNTAAQLEADVGGRLKDFAVRERIFKPTTMMLMAVIDPQWNRVTIYHRGINGASDLSAKDLKIAAKGSGPDVSEILKAYQMGTSPSL